MTKRIMLFTAPWCAGCQSIKAHLEKQKDKIEVETIDVEQNPKAAEEYGINNLPTLFFVRDSQFVKHRAGTSPAVLTDIKLFAEGE